MILRRSFLQGLGALFVAPAICRAESLMPIKEYAPDVPSWCPPGWLPLDGREIKKKFYPDLYAAYKRMYFKTNHLVDDQVFSIYGGFDPDTRNTYDTKRYRRIISAVDLKRANGRIMQAGAYYTLEIPELVS